MLERENVLLVEVLASPAQVVVDNVEFGVDAVDDESLEEVADVLVIISALAVDCEEEAIGGLVAGERLGIEALDLVLCFREALEVSSDSLCVGQHVTIPLHQAAAIWGLHVHAEQLAPSFHGGV